MTLLKSLRSQHWNLRKIDVDSSLHAQEKQMEADWGLAVFKPISKNRYGAIQASSGTLRNTIDMLLHKKAVKFFYLYENHMTYKNLRMLDDLKKVLSEYCNEHLSQAEMDEILSCKGVLPGSVPAWIKYQKIKKKYQELQAMELAFMKTKEKPVTQEEQEQISLFGK